MNWNKIILSWSNNRIIEITNKVNKMQIEQLDAYLGEGTDSLVYSVRGNDHIVAKVSKSNN